MKAKRRPDGYVVLMLNGAEFNVTQFALWKEATHGSVYPNQCKELWNSLVEQGVYGNNTL